VLFSGDLLRKGGMGCYCGNLYGAAILKIIWGRIGKTVKVACLDNYAYPEEENNG
jgi:hypothetical protein